MIIQWNDDKISMAMFIKKVTIHHILQFLIVSVILLELLFQEQHMLIFIQYHFQGQAFMILKCI